MIPVPVKYNFYGDVCSIIHSGSLLASGGIVLFNLISVLGTVFLGLSPKTLYFSYCPLRQCWLGFISRLGLFMPNSKIFLTCLVAGRE